MMFFRKKDQTDLKLKQLNNAIVSSFHHVKKDTSHIFQWLDYLYQRHMEQDRLIRELQQELRYRPQTREEIKRVIDDYYSYDNFHKKIEELNSKVEKLLGLHSAHSAKLENAHLRLDKLEEKPKPTSYLKERIIKRITKNSKDYVKNTIISLIRKYEKISALQLREMIVEERGLCSKSSFYRLLEEIEKEEEITSITEGKGKYYLFKAIKAR